MSFRYWVYLAAGLFVVGMGIGVIVSITMPPGITGLLSEEMSALGELGAIFGPFKAGTALFIFLKNVSVVLFGFIFSPVLCLLPFLTLIVNGLLLSFVVALVAGQTSLWLVAAAILPHGIFEIPAIIIGEAAALRFGFTLIRAIINPQRRAGLPEAAKLNLRYLAIAIILLVPAAVIETFVTPLLIQSVGS